MNAEETAGREEEEQGNRTIRKEVNRTSAASFYNNDEMYLFSTLGPGTPHHGPERK